MRRRRREAGTVDALLLSGPVRKSHYLCSQWMQGGMVLSKALISSADCYFTLLSANGVVLEGEESLRRLFLCLFGVSVGACRMRGTPLRPPPGMFLCSQIVLELIVQRGRWRATALALGKATLPSETEGLPRCLPKRTPRLWHWQTRLCGGVWGWRQEGGWTLVWDPGHGSPRVIYVQYGTSRKGMTQ